MSLNTNTDNDIIVIEPSLEPGAEPVVKTATEPILEEIAEPILEPVPTITNADGINFDHLTLRADDVDMIIYHGGCNDGFGAALCSQIWLQTNKPDKVVEFIPGSFSRNPPNTTGRNVVIFDFSYKYPIMSQMIKSAKSLAIVDHHKSAMEDLQFVSPENKLFLMNFSGAYLAWRFWFGNRDVPTFIKYIQDVDIWTKKLPLVEEFSCWILTLPQTFDEWKVFLDDDLFLETIRIEGPPMIKFRNAQIKYIIKHASIKFIEISSKYYFAAHLNTSLFKSEIGNQLLSLHPNVNFSVVYSFDDKDGGTYLSMRSAFDRTDVSALAKMSGGGGHYCAAATQINSTVTTIPCKIIDSDSLYHKLNNVYFNTLELDKNTYNIIYMNAEQHKYALAKYLLQDRNKTMQEGWNINQNRVIISNDANNTDEPTKSVETTKEKEVLQPAEIKRLHISAIWHYDGSTDKTIYTLGLDPTLNAEQRLSIYKYFDADTTITTGDILHTDKLGLAHKF
jgi:hypothetical protein